MANPGFNLKVRKVENGYTIHHTVVGAPDVRRGLADGESHEDFVAKDEDELKGIINTLIIDNLKDIGR